jgi:uncharacterized protein YndB with AHSA1/START domain
MPRVRRARTIAAEPEAVWAAVSDPRALSRWWPGVQRIEEVTPQTWTAVFQSSKGKSLRADYTRTEADSPRTIAWRQEVEESPFERFLAEAATRISLAPAAGGTRVEIRLTRRLRGLALLGGFMVRRATRRQLDEALAGLERLLRAA